MVPEEVRGKHERPEEPVGYWAEFRDAMAPRTVALVIGVLFLQLAFIWSYVGAFHNPSPHRIAVSVTVPNAPPTASSQAAARLNALPGGPLQATAVPTQQQARQRLRDGTDYAAYIISPTSTKDQLLTSGAMGSSVQTAVTEVFTSAAAAEHRTLSVTDALPLQHGDFHGLTGFYLVVGWLVGGYLVASLLGVAKGSRPANLRRAWFRLGAMVPYALGSGLGGAIIVDQGLDALTGHFVALWFVGAMLVAAAATVTMALQILFGTIGIGVTVLVFVILGNPSATGAYQQPMLPVFWRTIAYWLPNGAGTDSVRRIMYMSGTGITGHLIVIGAYIVAGTVVAVLAAALRQRRSEHHQLA
jgi:hypothetical protein